MLVYAAVAIITNKENVSFAPLASSRHGLAMTRHYVLTVEDLKYLIQIRLHAKYALETRKRQIDTTCAFVVRGF